MHTERVPSESPKSPSNHLFGALGFIAFFVGGIALIAVVVTLAFHPGSESSATEWTGVGRVCDFDAECHDDFKCRSVNGTVEIYLPSGSFSTGNEGWRWEDDSGERCGRPPE